MTNWYFDDPSDETAEFSIRTVVTEVDILELATDDWQVISNEHAQEIIDDFVVVNWASKTDMPPGTYPSHRRNWT